MLNTYETYYVCRLHSVQMDKQAIIYGKKNRLTASNFGVVLSAIRTQRYVLIDDFLVQIY